VIDDTPPTSYLVGAPRPGEADLAQAVGLHTGASVPFWMFARAVDRLHGVTSWATARDRVERRVRQAVIALGLALAGNLWLVVTTMQTRATEAGEARARSSDQAHELDQIRLDLRGLWQKVSGVDADQPPHTDVPPIIDRSHNTDQMSLIWPPQPQPLWCTAIDGIQF